MAQARTAAGGRNVAVASGATMLRQVLSEGLLDELELHIARSYSAAACACSTTA